MEQQLRLSPAQYEVLNMLSCINRDEDVVALKQVIVQFLNSRLQGEIEKLWTDGTINESKVASWSNMHMRTPYKDYD
ncbi:MAG: dephospho-CoA kinase [Prevotella sp.]|nr:dephospho-CoA kinase [Prevotella sp.]